MPQESKITEASIRIAHENSIDDFMGSHSNQRTEVDSVDDRQNSFPSILLTNLQSFGKPGTTDKISELYEVLRHNSIDVGVFTETWATDATVSCLEAHVEGYTMFHSIRSNCLNHQGVYQYL